MAAKKSTKAAAVKAGVPVILPKADRKAENYETASVNGKVYKIKRGEMVVVPEEVAEVLNNAMIAAGEADDYIDAHVN